MFTALTHPLSETPGRSAPARGSTQVLNRSDKRLFLSILLGVALTPSAATFAQTVPNAGRVLQELEQPPLKPKEDRQFPLLPPQAKEDILAGGAAVQIHSVHLSGNSVFSTALLLRQLGDVSRRTFDLAGMRTLAQTIASYYRSHGYPFTRVYIPAQDISKGDLQIQIVEGRYGRIESGGDPSLESGAARFLKALRPGDPIATRPLERVMLLLDNEPGMRVSPTMAPGMRSGEGDLAANIERVQRFGGEVGLGDQGDRYTGLYRERLSLYAYSPFMLGDMLSLRAIHTNENMWLGSLDYEAPLNGTGVRGHLGYSRTTYELGGQFEALGASGNANITTVGVSFPIVRSRQRNLVVALV